jgi:hypothetical protein
MRSSRGSLEERARTALAFFGSAPDAFVLAQIAGSARSIAAQHREILRGPDDLRVETGFAQPLQLRLDGIGAVEAFLEWDHDVLRPLGDHHVAEHEATSGAKGLGDPTEEVGFLCRREVMDREHGRDEVELSRGEGVLEPSEAKLDAVGWKRAARCREHLGTGVDADQARCAMGLEQGACSLAGPHPELENRVDSQILCRLDDTLLQLVVARNLRPDLRRVANGVPWHLAHVAKVARASRSPRRG